MTRLPLLWLTAKVSDLLSSRGRDHELPSLLTHGSGDLRDNGGLPTGTRHPRMAHRRHHAVGHPCHPPLAELAGMRRAALSRRARFESRAPVIAGAAPSVA